MLRWKLLMEIIDMYLYGASGHAKVIIDILESMGVNIAGLIDDNKEVKQLLEYPVEHNFHGQEPLIVSIGSNRIRKIVAERINGVYGQAISPHAVVSSRSKIGEGTVVMQGAIVQSDSIIGKHCIINTGASVDHECRLDDYVHVSPHATLCGNVTIGEGSWIGAGTTIIQGITIGRWCVIGAGSVVTHDVPDGYLAVGNRCKLIKKINQELL